MIVGFDLNALAARWWMLVVRGIAAILFGVLAILWPGISLLALVLLWGAYALADGVFGVMLAAGAGAEGRRWGWLLFEGFLSVAAGVVTFIWPGMTAFALLVLIALWAVFTGIAEIVAAVELRRVIRGEWLLALSGVLSIAFGVLMLLFPRAGALAVVTVIALYAMVFGALLTALGVRLHRLATSGRHPMAGGSPSHA
ncbi:MAG TPA: HdeD family acid-resistance protein [Polyangiaceae bacterium]|nr:HdeD family acid-resistance protein [Polyangiaceae bacterium]